MFTESEILERPLQLVQSFVSEHHQDVQLFAQDRYRRSTACLLFPSANTETIDFMRSLSDKPSFLMEEELRVLDDGRRPTFEEVLAQIRSTQAGTGAGALSQRMFPLKHLQKVLWHCQNKNEHYLAQNTFKGFQRSSENVRQLTSCWVDLDYYKLADTNIKRQLDDDDAAVDLILRCCTEGIQNCWFEPTQIIRSGRGIYVRWVFSHFLPGVAAPRWRRVMEVLIERFKDLGADTAARDAARVLRIVGSRNSKSKSIVRVLHGAKPIVFDDLALSVLEKERASFADRQATKLLAESSAARFGVYRTKKTTQHKQTEFDPSNRNSWPALAAQEIKNLAGMRGGAAKGHIELIVFYYMNFRIMGGLVVDHGDFEQQVREIGELMHANISQLLGEVVNVWKRKEAGSSPYRVSKKMLIDKLHITPQELASLPCLSKPIGAQQRSKTKRTRDERTFTHQRARLYEQSGMNIKTISEQLKVSPKTVKRWLVMAC